MNAPRRKNSNNGNGNSNIDINTVAESSITTGNNNLKVGSLRDEDDEDKFVADAYTTTDDNDDVVIVEGDDLGDASNKIIKQQREIGDDIESYGNEDEDKSTNSGTYPADCYSFLALHSPFDHLGFW